MDIDEAGRALVFRYAEAEKLKVTGSLVVTLHLQDGGILKASFQMNCPLVPGSRPDPRLPKDSDRPGINRG